MQSNKETCEKLETNLSALLFQSQVQLPVKKNRRKKNKTRGTHNKPCFVADMTWGANNHGFTNISTEVQTHFSAKGRVRLTNRMNFRKIARGGRGSFSIQKFILQILDLYKGFFQTFSKKNCNIIFPK